MIEKYVDGYKFKFSKRIINIILFGSTAWSSFTGSTIFSRFKNNYEIPYEKTGLRCSIILK